MDCLYCSTQLPDKGYYCPNCAKQFKCKSCNELLVKDANACIYCGKEVRNENVAPNMNIIEYGETKNTRNFKATFTDTVGQGISDSFGLILSDKISSRKSNITTPKGLPNNIDNRKIEEAEVIHDGPDTPELAQLGKIFKNDGNKITLSETRLKAASKLDYGKRVSILFIYYKTLSGIDQVPRKDLTAILQNASVEDGNLRHWIGTNPLIGVNNEHVELKAPGVDKAKQFLKEISNSEKNDGWQIGSHAKTARKTKTKKPAEKK